MKLVSLKIEGFRAIREVSIDSISDLTILVGPNGVGKSSIFQAISLLKDHLGSYCGSYSNPGSHVVNASHSRAVISATFELSAIERAFMNRITPSAKLSGWTESATLEIANGRCSLTQDNSTLRSLFSTFEPESGIGIIEHLSPYRRLTADGISSMDLRFDGPTHLGTEVYGGRSDYAELFRYLAQSLLSDFIHFRRTGQLQDSLKPFSELFDRLFAPKRLALPQVSERGLHFEVDTVSGRHRLNELSAGELEALAVFATLERIRPKQSIILYDSPELHLNGALERRVFKEMERVACSNQVLASTHSYEIIDAADVNSLIRIDTYDRRNQAVRLSAQFDRIRLFQSLGASVGVQLISKVVALVEGQTDVDLYKAAFPDLPPSVSFVSAGGVRNVLKAAAHGAQLIQESSAFSKFICIADRDYRSEEDRCELMKKYSPNLIVLSRYHIENYLLDADAIECALKKIGQKSLTASRIEQELSEIAEKMRENAILDCAQYQLDSELHEAVGTIKNAGPDPRQTFLLSSNSCLRTMTKLLEPASVELSIEKTRIQWEAKWDKAIWRTELKGRSILHEFAGKHGKGMSGYSFVHLVASAAAEVNGEGRRALKSELESLWSLDI